MPDKPDIVVVEGPFAVIAHRVHRDGKPYIGGACLRETADKAAVVCETCGPLPSGDLRLRVRGPDWLTLCHAALDHARTTGHRVAVESWQGAVYGPEEAG